MTDHRIEIHDGVTALSNTYEVDGRVSWHAPEARGYSTANCYLLQSGNDALLVDAGLPIHLDQLCKQLDQALRPAAQLSLLALRQGEFDSIGNMLPLIDRFNPTRIYGQFTDITRWADFRTEYDATDTFEVEGRQVEESVLSREMRMPLGADEERLEIFRPTLRLLSTHWIYDRGSKTLFTSDSFGYGVQRDESGPWLLTSDNDNTELDHVRQHLAGTRYWWLAVSQVDAVRESLHDIFARYEIHTIAPAFGAILAGPQTVARHYQLMDDAIASLGRASVAGSSV